MNEKEVEEGKEKVENDKEREVSSYLYQKVRSHQSEEGMRNMNVDTVGDEGH